MGSRGTLVTSFRRRSLTRRCVMTCERVDEGASGGSECEHAPQLDQALRYDLR